MTAAFLVRPRMVRSIAALVMGAVFLVSTTAAAVAGAGADGARPGPGAAVSGVRQAAPAAWFDVARTCAPFCSSIRAGNTISFTVTAHKAIVQGTWTGFIGNVTVVVSDPAADAFHSVTFTAADQGSKVIGVVFKTAGTQVVWVAAAADPSMSGESGDLAITAGAPKALRFVIQPVGAQVGSVLGAPPTVEIDDLYGNRTDSPASVTLSLVRPGGNMGTISCQSGLTVAALNGQASWPGCTVDTAGQGYRVLAESAGLYAATSNEFTVSPGPTPSPSPTPSPTASPSPTPTGTPGASPSPTPTGTPSASPTASPTTGPQPTSSPGSGTKVVLSIAGRGPRGSNTYTLRAVVQSAGAGRLVSFEQRPVGASTWSIMGAARTDALGGAQLTHTFTRAADVRAVWDGDATLPPGTSATMRFSVAWKVTYSPSTVNRKAGVGKALSWTVTVRPMAVTPVEFSVWQRVGRSWVRRGLVVKETTAKGKATFSWKFTSAGRYYVVAEPPSSPVAYWVRQAKKNVTVK